MWLDAQPKRIYGPSGRVFLGVQNTPEFERILRCSARDLVLGDSIKQSNRFVESMDLYAPRQGRKPTRKYHIAWPVSEY